MSRELGRTGISVDEVGVGCWQLGGAWGPVDEAEAVGLLRSARTCGANLFDTALEYGGGRSERLLRSALGRGIEDVTVVTKVPPKDDCWAPTGSATWKTSFPGAWVDDSLRQSLRNLGTETVDVLLLHTWSSDWPPEALAAIGRLRDAGFVRFIGISTPDASSRVSDECLELIDVLEVNLSATNQEPLEWLAPRASRHGTGVIARCPFSSGALAVDWSARPECHEADWRMAWVDQTWWDSQRQNSEIFGQLCRLYGVGRVPAALAVSLSGAGVAVTIPGARSAVQVTENLTCNWQAVPPELLERVRSLYKEGAIRPVYNGAG